MTEGELMLTWKSLTRLGCVALLLLAVGCKTDPETAKRRYLESGQRYFEKKQFNEASIQFRKALQIDPRYAEAYERLGETEMQSRHWQEAYKAFSQLALLDPNNVKAHTQVYQLYMNSHQYLEAEQEAAALIRLDPSSANAYEMAGGAAFARQLYKDAREDFAKARDLSQGAPSTQLNLASAQIALGDYVGAEQGLKAALDKDPHFIPAYQNLASLYQVQGKVPLSVQTIRTGIQKNPDAEELYAGLARSLFATGDSAGGEQALADLRARRGSSPTAQRAIGDVYTEQSQPDKAMQAYQEGLRRDPKNNELRMSVLQGFLAQGKVREATEINEQALKDDPKNPAFRVGHARITMASPANQAAGIEELKKIISDSPDYSDAHYYLGQAYLAQGNGKDATGEFEDAVRSNPRSVDALHAAAALHASHGAWDVATDYAQRCVRLRPSDARQRSLLGSILLHHNDPKSGLQQLHIATLLAPSSPEAHLSMAQGYHAIGDFKNAESELAAAAKAGPDMLLVVGATADYWVSRKQPEKAAAFATQFIQSHPNDVRGQLILASTLLQSQRYAEAQVALDKALQLQPNLVEAYALLGELHQRKGESQAAIDAYSRGIKIEPKSAALYAAVGGVYLEGKDMANARIYLEKSLSQDPNFAVASSNLAWVYAQQNTNLDVAVGLAQKAKQALPDSATVTDTLAWVYIKKGNFSGAVPLLQECVKKSPESALYHYHLAVAFMGRGDKTRAKAELDSAIRLKLGGAEGDEAKQMLAQLR
jgi:tetratricopeptide (TPR) repeat protein